MSGIQGVTQLEPKRAEPSAEKRAASDVGLIHLEEQRLMLGVLSWGYLRFT